MTPFEQAVLAYKPRHMKDVGKGRFGAKVVEFPPSLLKGIVKFKQFSNKRIRGVPKDEMHKREVAAYHLDRDVLRFHVVPPAMLIKMGGKEASISEYIDGLLPRQVVPDLFRDDDEKKRRLALFFAKVKIEDAIKIVLLDLIIDNCDRHGLNVLVKPRDNSLVAIDNGMSFGRGFRYYRNVLHRYAFLHKLPVPEKTATHLRSIRKDQVAAALTPFLGKREVNSTWDRLQFILGRIDRLDYHTLSQGQYGKDDFPDYLDDMSPTQRPLPTTSFIVGPISYPMQKAHVRKEAYGHVAYVRQTKSGKLSYIKPKGVKPIQERVIQDEFVDFEGMRDIREARIEVTALKKAPYMESEEAQEIYQNSIVREPDLIQYLHSGGGLESVVGMVVERDYDLKWDRLSLSSKVDIMAGVMEAWQKAGVLKVIQEREDDLPLNSGMTVKADYDQGGTDQAVDQFNETLDAYAQTVFDFVGANGGLKIEVESLDITNTKNLGGLYNSTHRRLRVSTKKGLKPFAHEYGHYMDHVQFGHAAKGQYGSEMQDNPLSKFVKKLKANTLFKYRMKKIIAAYGGTKGNVFGEESGSAPPTGRRTAKEYFNDDSEVFARFFNEWLHDRAASDDSMLSTSMYSEWRPRDDDSQYTWQPVLFITHKNAFEKLAREFESLLDKAGIDWRPHNDPLKAKRNP